MKKLDIEVLTRDSARARKASWGKYSKQIDFGAVAILIMLLVLLLIRAAR